MKMILTAFHSGYFATYHSIFSFSFAFSALNANNGSINTILLFILIFIHLRFSRYINFPVDFISLYTLFLFFVFRSLFVIIFHLCFHNSVTLISFHFIYREFYTFFSPFFHVQRSVCMFCMV